MSMEHLQQFLRQQDQITQVAMDTLHVPFDLKSVRYAAAGAGTDDTKSLSIAIESTVPSCSVQILWDLDIATAISTLSQPRGFVSTSKRRMYFPRSMSAFWSNFWSKWTQSVATDGGDQQPLQDTSGSSSSPPSTSTNMLHHPSSSLLDLDNGELRRLLPCQLRTDPLILHAEPPSTPSTLHYTNSTLPRPSSTSTGAVVLVQTAAHSHVQVVVHPSPSHDDHATVGVTTALFVLDLASSSIKQRMYYHRSTSSNNVLVAHDIYGADEFVECSICLEDPTTAIVLPCRHKCICATCLAEIDACPICRAKFASYITS
ncbi:hypothetical protein, variant [Aphanomyces astaci]|nr:hypothetical protein, variant [Aphanomyces astaci]ETV69270.1 hypothetical protein, variant [Aphanomyces astaci]|eukprot:XP_009841127.1 hypothetical protein, variant [Aphanomyces astaci]